MDDRSYNDVAENASKIQTIDSTLGSAEGIEEPDTSPSQIDNNESETKDSSDHIDDDNNGKRESVLKKILGWKRYLGVIYVLCAVNCSALGSNILKLLSHIDPITLSLYSYPVGIFLAVPFVWHRWKISPETVMDNVLPIREHKKVIFFIWLRAFCTVLLTLTLIWSIKYIMVSDSRTIFATSVIVVNIFGCIFFKEKCGIVTTIVSIIALRGVGVMTKPPILTGKSEYDDDTLKGIAIAFVCMLCSSVNMLILRYLGNVYHGVLNLFLFTWAFFSTLPFAIGFEKMQIPEYTTWDILGIIGYGIIAALTNIVLVLALQLEAAGVVALVRTSELIFVFIWKMILLKVYPDWISILGGFLVLTGVMAVGIRKWIEGKDEESIIRKRLKWLLL